MRIVTVGDLHGSMEHARRVPVKKADIFLLTGDLGEAKLMRKMAFDTIERQKQGLPEKKYSPAIRKRAFMEAYNSSLRVVKYLARHAPVYTIFGNVESSNAQTRKESKKIGLPLPYITKALRAIPNVHLINNKTVQLGDVKIGGLEYFIDENWVEEFKPKNYERWFAKAQKVTERAKKTLNRFEDIDILLCHQPPYGILDQVTSPPAPKHWNGKHAGSKVVLDYIKRTKPQYVVCGHIHEGEGEKKVGKTTVYNLGFGSYRVIEF